MSTFKPESCGNSGKSVDGSYSFVMDHELCKCNSASLDLLGETKWWLNRHGPGKGYSCDQLNVLESDVKLFRASYVYENSKAIGENQLIEEYCTAYTNNDATFCSDKPLKHFYSLDKTAKTDEDSWLRELESLTEDSLERTPLTKDMEEFWLSNAHLMDLDSGSSPVFEQPKKHCSDLDAQWVGLKKIEPWWHSADKDAVASLVSQRSSSLVKNCDLPKPQALHLEKGSADCTNCFEQVKEQMSNKTTKVLHVADCTQGNLTSVKDVKGSYVADCAQGNYASVKMDKSPRKLGLTECTVQGLDGTISSNGGSSTAKVNLSDTHEPTSGGLSKSQLLEALCHSQTRAREAEKLAQEACGEKDHIIDLFLRQASHLFAYRQWLQILQIETLCLNLGSENYLSSITSPAFSPMMGRKSTILRKNRGRVAKKKPGKQRCYINKCAVAFAVGLSLAGAGLLVGWTIGWLFPAF